MIMRSLKQFKWRRNRLTFKQYAWVLLVAAYVVNPSVAQAAYDQQPASGKQLCWQPPVCQCTCSCSPSTPPLNSVPPVCPGQVVQSAPPVCPGQVVQSVPQVRSAQVVHSVPQKRSGQVVRSAHRVRSAQVVHSAPQVRSAQVVRSAPPVHSAQTVHSAPQVRSTQVVYSVPPGKRSSSATAQYKPLSSPPPYESKYPPLFISKLDYRSKIIFQAGAFNSSQGRTQDVYVNSIYDIYTITNHNSQNVLLGLGYYIYGFDKPRYSLWYGLNVFYLAPSTVSGNVIQEGLYPNLSYRYTVTQLPIYLDIKGILHTNSPKYDVTFDLGAGPSIVRTSNIQEYPRNPSSIPDAIFKGSTRTLPSISAGVGFKVNNLFSNQASVECGYRFFYTTQTKFSHYYDSTPTSGPLYTGNNFVNAVMCSIIL